MITTVVITTIEITAIVIPTIVIAAIVTTGITITTVVITTIMITTVVITTIAIAGAAFSSIHNFKQFCPRDFTNDMDFVGARFIILCYNIPQSKNFCNLIFRVKIIVIEAVSSFFTKMKTTITN